MTSKRRVLLAILFAAAFFVPTLVARWFMLNEREIREAILVFGIFLVLVQSFGSYYYGKYKCGVLCWPEIKDEWFFHPKKRQKIAFNSNFSLSMLAITIGDFLGLILIHLAS